MRTISVEKLSSELANRPGLIPISVNLNRNQLNWCDVGTHQFTEPGFNDFLVWHERQSEQYPMFACDLRELAGLTLPDNCIPPTGFIFHAGRCDSTLFSRALAQSPRHVVISEAQPHNEIWAPVTGSGKPPVEMTEEQLKRVAMLIRLMGRRREAEVEDDRAAKRERVTPEIRSRMEGSRLQDLYRHLEALK